MSRSQEGKKGADGGVRDTEAGALLKRLQVGALLLYCCFTAALLLLYCCFTAGGRSGRAVEASAEIALVQTPAIARLRLCANYSMRQR